MIIARQTLARIDAVINERSEEERRGHLGASMLGRKCEREVWYGFRWAINKKFSPRMKRLFLRGHREEETMADLLRSVGATVLTVDPDTGEQFRGKFIEPYGGGSCDGVGTGGISEIPGDDWYVCEFKTHNDKSFKKLVEEGLMAAKWEHFCQSQIYMEFFGLDWTVYVAVNKNDDSFHIEIIRRDPAVFARLMERANRIIFEPSAPKKIAESSTHWQCKFCDARNVCHMGELPERNCRTCQFAKTSKSGWVCSLGQAEIKTQVGCNRYVVSKMFR